MIAIIGDIVNSRKVKERNQLQEKLKSCLANINRKYISVITSEFIVTGGDGFQGLLIGANDLFQILDVITFTLYPGKLRYGVGIGRVTTEINYKNSLENDGPAYWAARKAINHIHALDYYGKVNIHVQSENEHPALALVNKLLAVTAFIASNWRDTQVAVMRALLEEGIWSDKFEQKRIAEKMGISSVALSRRLATSGLKLYIQARSEAESMLRGMNDASYN
jgi:hypothetical protein